jgi:hypothetical protein
MLTRPAGYGTAGYGYNYYHRARPPLKVTDHLECVIANYTLYTKVKTIVKYEVKTTRIGVGIGCNHLGIVLMIEHKG